MTSEKTGRRSLSILALLLGLAGCTKRTSLVLLDLRPSGPLGAPVARIRLSAKGWPKRTVDGTLDPAGFRVGYYGPGDGSAVTRHRRGARRGRLRARQRQRDRPGARGRRDQRADDAVRPPATRQRLRPRRRHGRRRPSDDGGDGGAVDAGMDATRRRGRRRGGGRGTGRGRRSADDAADDAGVPDAGVPDADDDATATDAQSTDPTRRLRRRPLPAPRGEARVLRSPRPAKRRDGGEGSGPKARVQFSATAPRLPDPRFSSNLWAMKCDAPRRRGVPRLALACSMDDPCAPQASACGGDPTGLWTVMDSCRDPAYELPKPVTYFDQAQTMARQPPPEPTSSDWCSYLHVRPGRRHHAVHLPARHAVDRDRTPSRTTAPGRTR